VFLECSSAPPSDGIVFCFASWSSTSVAAFRVLTSALARWPEVGPLYVCDADDLPKWFESNQEVGGKGETLGFAADRLVASVYNYDPLEQEKRVWAFLEQVYRAAAPLPSRHATDASPKRGGAT
jgi:hypothetical protein